MCLTQHGSLWPTGFIQPNPCPDKYDDSMLRSAYYTLFDAGVCGSNPCYLLESPECLACDPPCTPNREIQQAVKNRMNVFPIPCQNILNIESDSKTVPFTIIDMYGKIAIDGIFYQDHHMIDLSVLSPGIYFLHDHEGNSYKIVKI